MKRKFLWKPIVAILMSAALVCMALSLNDAKAYQYLVCDGGDDPITWSEECPACAVMAINTIDFPPGSATWNRLLEAMDAWNDVEGSTFDFIAQPDIY